MRPQTSVFCKKKKEKKKFRTFYESNFSHFGPKILISFLVRRRKANKTRERKRKSERKRKRKEERVAELPRSQRHGRGMAFFEL